MYCYIKYKLTKDLLYNALMKCKILDHVKIWIVICQLSGIICKPKNYVILLSHQLLLDLQHTFTHWCQKTPDTVNDLASEIVFLPNVSLCFAS